MELIYVEGVQVNRVAASNHQRTQGERSGLAMRCDEVDEWQQWQQWQPWEAIDASEMQLRCS